LRSLSIALALVLATAATPEPLVEDPFPVYTGDEFKALYDHAVRHELSNLTPTQGRLPVTGDPDLDARIWDLAIARGYVLRPLAGPDLATVDGVPMQPQAAEAWEQLRVAARAAGHQFVVSSAYRPPESQRVQFNSKLTGTTNEAIAAALTWYSVPGTSKHHGGYALDFRYAEGTFGEFRETPDYAWLSEDNFLNAKRFGFIPSYPDDVTAQGPNPEPWEFVWVGVELIRCGMACVEAASGPLARHPGGKSPLEFAFDRNARRRQWRRTIG
jgi:hypothetical protein